MSFSSPTPVSPPPKASLSPNHSSKGSSSGLSYDELQQALDIEQSESLNLQRQLQDTRRQLVQSQNLHSQLEMDMVDFSKQVSVLENKINELKRSKSVVEDELGKCEIKYLNQQSKFIEMEEELKQLKKAPIETHQAEKPHKRHSRMLSISSFMTGHSIPPPTPTEASSLEKMQSDLRAKELHARHEKIDAELRQIKDLNSRLIDENESLKLLMIGKIIEDIASEDALSIRDKRSGDVSDIEDNTTIASSSSSINLEHSSSSPHDELIRNLEIQLRNMRVENKTLLASLAYMIQSLMDSQIKGDSTTSITNQFESRLIDSTNLTSTQISAFLARFSTPLSTSTFTPITPFASNTSSSSVNKRYSTGQGTFGHVSRNSFSSSMTSSSRSRFRKSPGTWSHLLMGGSTPTASNMTSPAASTIGHSEESDSSIGSPTNSVSPTTGSSLSSIEFAGMLPIEGTTVATTTGTTIPIATTSTASVSVVRRPSTNGMKQLKPLNMTTLS